MANIKNELNNIKNALYGKDVRNSIHDAIEQCYIDASINGNANMEVTQARGEHETLGERLDDHASQLAHKANNSYVNDLQGQVNNLVLGATGDGNNAEVIQARSSYSLLNDRLNVIESGYKKVDFGYIDLTNIDFVNSTQNRMATNGIPITEKGIITVNYVPKQTLVYIQHLRYIPKEGKFIIIENMTVQCTKDVINTTVCNFNINTDGYDYIAVEGLGFTTNDTSVGYLFLLDTGIGYGSDTTITEYIKSLNKNYGASFGYYVTVHQIDTDDIKESINNTNNSLLSLDNKISECEDNLRILKYDNEEEQTINMVSGGFWHQEYAFLQENSSWTYFWHNESPINVVPGEVYRITNIGGTGNLHPVLLANSKSVNSSNGYINIKWMYPDSNELPLTVYDEIFIKIPKDIDLMYINSHTSSGNSINDLHIYKVLDAKYEYIKAQDVIEMQKNLIKIEDTVRELSDNKNSIDDLEFELNNLKNRCTKYDNFDFTWKDFDKSYFAITIDDSNNLLAGFYDVAHSKNIPISTACVHTRLDHLEKGGTRSIREINNLIVADGGEILGHYAGSPTENTSYEEWLTYTRDVKKALTEEGWTIRGLIRADSTQANTKKAESLCRQYYDYADSMGTSNHFNLGQRKFLIGVQTLDDFKSWVDTCCKTPGFYPICVHGGRTDEPLATNEYMGQIIDYINSKTNAEFTTYAEIFDKFGTIII